MSAAASSTAPARRVLLVCAELFPLLKTGGLADVCAALPPALQALGHDTRLVLPGFAALQADAEALGAPLPLPTHGGPAIAAQLGPAACIQPVRLRGSGLRAYLLQADALYHRDGGPYDGPDGHAWPDNDARFALLGWAGACLGLGADPDWRPDVVHAHDWHAALAPAYLVAVAPSPASRPVSVFTIHNLAFQGLFDAERYPALGLPPAWFALRGLEFHGRLSFMKAGLQFADALTTVSPRYAAEIQTEAQGCGLDGLLRERAADLHGILNGVDDAHWNPAHDPCLPATYDAHDLRGKARTKAALQAELGLRVDPDAPLFGAVTRLTHQKGVDLLPPALATLVARGGQFAVLGSGDPALVQALREAVAAHPGAAALRLGYDETLAHRIVAGADVLLMPSRFEPCGLTQLYALRYGTLPLVHAVGGLADTVTDCSLENIDDGRATGFVFDRFGAQGLDAALRRAFALRRRPADWHAVQAQAMACRFGWDGAARDHVALFDTLLARRAGAAA